MKPRDKLEIGVVGVGIHPSLTYAKLKNFTYCLHKTT
jgi:hypothetical protein